MNPQLINAMANSRIDDLHRSAAASRTASELRGPSRVSQVVRTMLNLRLRERPLTTAAPTTIAHA